jgi:hypothetical protein
MDRVRSCFIVPLLYPVAVVLSGDEDVPVPLVLCEEQFLP